MSDKQTSFTVTDRRKFTLDGELRDPAAAEETHAASGIVTTNAVQHPAATPPPANPRSATGAGQSLDIDPDPLDEALDGDGPEQDLQDETLAESLAEPLNDDLDEYLGDDLGPIPTSKESADQHAAYQKTSGQIDDMIREANPSAPPAAEVNFEQVVQSFYLSAVIAMGAAAEPGQKPRVDIIGARQSIDMLAVLVEKTKGNLNDREQKLLQTALFNLRMMFLELTNNIAAQAAKAPKPGVIR